MGYIDDYIRYHLNPKYCENLKEEIIQRLKDDALYNEKTEVDVLSHYDILTDQHRLLVVVDRTPLIDLDVDRNSSTADTTWRVMKAYKERFGDVKC